MNDRQLKIVLVGNPNSGKSLLFSRMTGTNVISSNYPGTTVEVTKGRGHFQGKTYELIDIPGIYSLEPFSKADETALRLIDEADAIVNVVDATNLERNLNLTLQLLKKRKPMVVCLNFWDDTKHKGIVIDSALLQTMLDVPVVAASAFRNEGIVNLAASLNLARVSNSLFEDADSLWRQIGTIVTAVQKLSHRHHTALEWLSDFTLHPAGGIVVALAVLVATFTVIRILGEVVAQKIFDPLYTHLYFPHISHLLHYIPNTIVKEMLLGTSTDPFHSFGLLTTGVYIAVVLVFPYFFSFYFVFGFLEDFGYLPRLAIVLDALFHRLGLHGHSSIPILLGFGCKVPALFATRVLTGRREKVLTTSLILMSAPCLPQSVMIVSIGMHYGIMTVIAIFTIILMLSLVINTALQKLTKGELPELTMELPSYRMPSIGLLGRKLGIRIIDYFGEIFPLIAAGVLVIHFLDALQVMDFISNTVGKLCVLLLGLPRDSAAVLIFGFLRKDVSIALLSPLGLTGREFIIAGIFMVLYSPCMASLFTLIKELGPKLSLAIAGLSFFSALAATTLLHLIFLVV
jgi:ferrous iron transport protein B